MGKTLTDEEADALGLNDDTEEPSVPSVGMGDVRLKDHEEPPDIAGLSADLRLKAGLHNANKARSRVEMLEKVLAAAQTGSLGFGDQMAGAEAAIKGGDYRKEQMKAEAEAKGAQRKHPLASLAGAVPHMFVPGANSVAGRVGLAGLVGGASAYGDSPGDSSVMDSAKDSGKGALTSMAIQGGLEVASPMLARLAKAFRNTAESQAARAMGAEGGITDKMRKMGVGDEEARHKLARTALDEGLLDFSWGVWPPSKATVADRARDMVDTATNTQKSTLSEATLKQPFDYAAAGNEMRKSMHGANAAELRSLGPTREGVRDLLKQGRMTPGDFQKASDVKSTLMGRTNYGDVPNLKDAEKFKRASNSALRSSIEDQVLAATGADIGEINRKIGQGLKIEELAKNAASRTAQRNTIGLGDKIVGAGTLASGGGALDGLAKAGGYSLAHNLSNQFGNAVAAKTLDNVLEPLAKLASKSNTAPAAVGAAVGSEDEDRERVFKWLSEMLGK